jgi:hypothetical protein
MRCMTSSNAGGAEKIHRGDAKASGRLRPKGTEYSGGAPHTLAASPSSGAIGQPLGEALGGKGGTVIFLKTKESNDADQGHTTRAAKRAMAKERTQTGHAEVSARSGEQLQKGDATPRRIAGRGVARV